MGRSDDTVEIVSVGIENLRGEIEEHDIFVKFTWKNTVMYTSIARALGIINKIRKQPFSNGEPNGHTGFYKVKLKD